MKKKNLALLVGVLAIAGSTGWYFNQGAVVHAQESKAGARAPGQQPPTTVNAVAARRQDVGMDVAANGTVTPLRTVDLHPQTTSTIRTVHIKEGQFVKAGQMMFSLDDREGRANVDKAQAQVARDQAALADIERQYKRSQELFEQKFIAQSAVETLHSQVESARALLKSDAAAARASHVNASYTEIRAPMSGRVGAINVYPGSLVQLATSLTTITQLDPINVSFTLPESALGSLLEAQKRGQVTVEARAGQGKPVTGRLSFIDNTVDPTAGTIRVKAEFDNRDTNLWPGQYVNTRVTVNTLKDAVVIPQNAIITNARGTYVYVVDADQTAHLVPVKTLYGFGVNAAVSGLAGTERVITEGKQNLRPGGKVRLADAGKPEGGKPEGGPRARGGKKGDQA
jgi:membrane fusion protein, multidrug efflux system